MTGKRHPQATKIGIRGPRSSESQIASPWAPATAAPDSRPRGHGWQCRLERPASAGVPITPFCIPVNGPLMSGRMSGLLPSGQQDADQCVRNHRVSAVDEKELEAAALKTIGRCV